MGASYSRMDSLMAHIAEYKAQDDRDLPGAIVDELLAAGDVEAARAEFERLCLEGLHAEPVPMSSEAWAKFGEDLKRKARVAS